MKFKSLNLKEFAIIFGAILIVVGILGFVPGITVNGHLLGLFMVDTLHNLVHIITGAIALLIAYLKPAYCKLYFQVVGIIYAVLAVLGLLLSGNLFLMHFNLADNLLHLAIAAVTLYLGFVYKHKR